MFFSIPLSPSGQDVLGWRDKQLPDGTVIWTSQSGATYVTTPGSALLFPSLCVPTGDIAAPEAVIDHRGERVAMMPKRRRTRTQNRAHRIAAERQHNRQTRLARRAQMVSYFAESPPTSVDDEPPPF